MKKTLRNLATGLLVLVSITVSSQSPQKFSYQTVIRNSSNQLLANQQVGIKISILQGSETGIVVYSERHTPSTNANGLATLSVGTGNVQSGVFQNINWSSGLYYIQTETDPNGGNNYTITSTQQLLSVPYALFAETSGSSTPGPQGEQGPIGPAGLGGFIHFIGEEFGGGVIFHIWKDILGIEHGLIIDKNDLSNEYIWSNIESEIGPSAQSSWDGLSNGIAIVSQSGHTSSAALLCLNSTNGGQSDWYLPSIDELSLLYQNRFNINKTLSIIVEATVLSNTAVYWSCTEYYENSNAICFIFNRGYTSNDVKNAANKVRAVRAF